MPYRGRRLTSNEITIARTIYGDSINYRAIRINSNLFGGIFKAVMIGACLSGTLTTSACVSPGLLGAEKLEYVAESSSCTNPVKIRFENFETVEDLTEEEKRDLIISKTLAVPQLVNGKFCDDPNIEVYELTNPLIKKNVGKGGRDGSSRQVYVKFIQFTGPKIAEAQFFDREKFSHVYCGGPDCIGMGHSIIIVENIAYPNPMTPMYFKAHEMVRKNRCDLAFNFLFQLASEGSSEASRLLLEAVRFNSSRMPKSLMRDTKYTYMMTPLDTINDKPLYKPRTSKLFQDFLRALAVSSLPSGSHVPRERSFSYPYSRIAVLKDVWRQSDRPYKYLQECFTLAPSYSCKVKLLEVTNITKVADFEKQMTGRKGKCMRRGY